MTITCIFNRPIYRDIESYLYAKFRAYVHQHKNEDDTFTLRTGVCDFDVVNTAKYLAKQKGILDILYEEDKF